jgi:hypothetical protein
MSNGMLKTVVLVNTALKFVPKCSFMAHQLRCFVEFCPVCPALMTFFNTLSKAIGNHQEYDTKENLRSTIGMNILFADTIIEVPYWRI